MTHLSSSKLEQLEVHSFHDVGYRDHLSHIRDPGTLKASTSENTWLQREHEKTSPTLDQLGSSFKSHLGPTGHQVVSSRLAVPLDVQQPLALPAVGGISQSATLIRGDVKNSEKSGDE